MESVGVERGGGRGKSCNGNRGYEEKKVQKTDDGEREPREKN